MKQRFDSSLTCSILLSIIVLSVSVESLLADESSVKPRIFQYSSLNGLLTGQLEGELTYGELSEKGDFGLGTFNGLDGEMVVLDGDFYRVDSNGLASAVADDVKIPFAVVTPFVVHKSFPVPGNLTFTGLSEFIDSMIDHPDHIQVIRINGHFKELLVRGVPKQVRPFRPLVEIQNTDEVRFEYKNVEGTLVGFRTAGYMDGLSVGGYHFHLIDKQRTFGGHVLYQSNFLTTLLR